MRNLSILRFIALTVILSACSKDPQSVAPEGSRIRFDQIEKGQRSRYVLFMGRNFYDDKDDHFEYLPDTLTLRVVEQDNKGWLIEEKLAPGSKSLHGEANLEDPAFVSYYYFNVQGDSLLVTPGPQNIGISSRLFSYSTKLSLSLAPVQSPKANMEGWKMKPYCKSLCSAYVPKYSLFGIDYGRLNLFSDTPSTLDDAPGIFYAYSRDAGLVKSVRFGGWSARGLGWDLLPD